MFLLSKYKSIVSVGNHSHAPNTCNLDIATREVEAIADNGTCQSVPRHRHFCRASQILVVDRMLRGRGRTRSVWMKQASCR